MMLFLLNIYISKVCNDAMTLLLQLHKYEVLLVKCQQMLVVIVFPLIC